LEKLVIGSRPQHLAELGDVEPMVAAALGLDLQDGQRIGASRRPHLEPEPANGHAITGLVELGDPLACSETRDKERHPKHPDGRPMYGVAGAHRKKFSS
jgi:hypothetical protein